MNKLKIISLDLVKYQRLALSSDKCIRITPNNIHLILGTNGSGKSSIMELITPLPPVASDFDEGGGSTLHFMYGKDFYIRSSSDNKHSLYKNNEVVIEGCGINKMIELCEELFNITPAIHKFMLGKTNMCNMSLQNRKEFITSISGIDFDYVNMLYSNVKKKLKYNSDVIKHLNSKILSMKEYILSEEEIKKLMKDKDDLKSILVELYESKKKEANKININKVDIVKIERRISNLEIYISDYRLMYGLELDRDSLQDNHTKLSAIIEDREKRLSGLSNQLLEASNTISDSEYNNRVRELKNSIAEISKDMTLIYNDYDNLKWYNSFIDELLELSLRLGEYTYVDITNRHTSTLTKIKEIEDSIDRFKVDIIDLNKRVDMYTSAIGNIKCPDCGFSFHSDGVDLIIKSIETEILEKSNSLDIAKVNLSKLLPILEDDKKLLSDMDRLLYLLKITNFYRLDTPVTEIQILHIHKSLLSLSKDLSKLPELKRLNDELETLSLYTISGNTEAIDILNKEYDDLTSNIKLLKEQHNKLYKIVNENQLLSNDILELKEYIKNKHTNRKIDINNLKNKTINTIVLEINNKLSNIENTIDKFNYMNKSTLEHSKEIDTLSTDIEILEILLKELSPSTGLIAESLKSFLLGYIAEVNTIISRVWSYDMEVLPYDVKELEKGMSYRFPVKIKDNRPAKDINDTSESMREIVNLAFRLISLKYMGLLEFPILIDEFGRSMDEVHLIKSYDLLENISIENDIQMFIIAHIKSCYNRFRSSGMTIVSDLNIENLE